MKRPPYITVEEMRSHPEWQEKESADGGTRFRGSTSPEIAFKYFTNKDGHILECGPHMGMFTRLLQDEGYVNIHTLDFYDALKFVSKDSTDSRIVDLNTEKFPFEDNYFEGVTAWGIGEHMENPFHFMREVHRTMKSGGIFIFALPNIFHIISRLLFLKRGDFPRWSEKNNHIMIFSKATFKKTFLRYFDLVETVYTKPGIQYLFFSKFNKFLPTNEWTGNWVVYVLRKK